MHSPSATENPKSALTKTSTKALPFYFDPGAIGGPGPILRDAAESRSHSVVDVKLCFVMQHLLSRAFEHEHGTTCSSGVNVHSKLETSVAYLVLESQTYELGLALFEKEGEGRGSLQANGATSVLDITEMRPRDTEKL